jgi:hypothetical protein
MHAAPPVRMSLAPERAWLAARCLIAGAAAANAVAWLSTRAQASQAVVAAAALGAAALAAWFAAWAMRPGNGLPDVLAWDGAVWQWSGSGSPPVQGEVRVMIDLGAWLLLRFSPSAPPQRAVWRAVSRRHAGPSWRPWRAALHARRRSGEPPAAPLPR